jgi:hypothetical protein
MNAMLARDELIDRVNHMSDEQVASLLEFIRLMQDKNASAIRNPEPAHKPDSVQMRLEDYVVAMSSRTPDNYIESEDPMLQGFFSGPPDLASRTKDILREEFGQRKPDSDNEAS